MKNLNHLTKSIKYFCILCFLTMSFPTLAALTIDATTTPNTLGIVSFSDLTPAQKFQARGGITVAKGGHLDIDEDITYFDIGGNVIQVEVGDGTTPGGVLEIHAKVQVNPNNNAFEIGVTVTGDANSPHFTTEPDKSTPHTTSKFYGVLDPIHGRILLGANCELYGYINSYNGGIIESFEKKDEQSPILRGYFHLLRIENAVQSPSAIRLNGVKFSLELEDVDGEPAACVQALNVKGAYFGGCIFANYSSNKEDGSLERGHGVAISNFDAQDLETDKSSITIGEASNIFFTPLDNPTCVIGKIEGCENEVITSEFFHLSTAVITEDFINDYTNTAKAQSISVSNSEFKSNFRDIVVNSIEIEVHDCDFDRKDSDLDNLFENSSFTALDIRAIEIIEPVEALIFRNFIDEDVDINHWGKRQSMISVVNAGGSAGLAKKILIRKNEFNGDVNGVLPSKYCIQANGNLRNLEWTCNKFRNSNIDVSYSGRGPLENPFYKKVPAGNEYLSSNQYKIENLSIDKLNYHRDVIGPLSPVNDPLKFDFDNLSGEFLCDITCDELDDIRDKLDVGGTASINETKYAEVFLSPNPASTIIHLDIQHFEKFDNGIILIMNQFGQEILSKKINSSKVTLPVDGLQTGLYLIKLEGNNVSQTKKLLIQR